MSNSKLRRASSRSFHSTCSPFGLPILKLPNELLLIYLIALSIIHSILRRTTSQHLVPHTLVRISDMCVKEEFSEVIILLQSLYRLFSKVLVITLSSNNVKFFIPSLEWNDTLNARVTKHDK